MTCSRSTAALALRIVVIAGKNLTARDREAVVRLCSAAFECDYGPLLNAFGDAMHVIGYAGDEIVSHALWISRPLRVGDGPPSNVAYVEAVATRADHQRKGYGSAVMREVHSRIADYDFGALSTGVYEWYESLGWQKWLGPLVVDHDGRLSRTLDETVMVYAPSGRPPDITASLTAQWRAHEVW